jgi:4-hydroxy-tetrahydrodipicolinate reductase
MGKAVCGNAAEFGAEVVAGTDIAQAGSDFPVYKTINDCNIDADAVIDFLPPTAADETQAILDFCVLRKTPLVICTTAIPPPIEAAIEKAAEKTALLRSANMSLGINLLGHIIKRAAALLYDSGFDIEIIEKHHNQKLDSPSGTAILLAAACAEGIADETVRYVHGRNGNEKRTRNEIGIHALRGGSIVGEHSVVFAGAGEVLEFTHIAQSRDIFAMGALKAAEFLQGKAPGLYTMEDVIK